MVFPKAIFLKISEALKKLFNDDSYLFKKRVSERAITHKLAEHLQEQFGEEFNVDCEYNKNLDDPKKLKEIKNYVKKRRDSGELSDCEENYGICVSPDIIIHRRGESNCNFLVLEIKRGDNSFIPDEEYDLLKLKSYIKELGYQFGIFIKFKMGEAFGIQKICIIKLNSKNKTKTHNMTTEFKNYLKK